MDGSEIDVDALVTSAKSAANEIQTIGAQVAGISANIEDARLHAETVRNELDTALAATAGHSTNSKAQEAIAVTSAANAQVALTEIKSLQECIAEKLNEIHTSQQSADVSAKALAELAARADAAEKKVEAYEIDIQRLISAADGQLKAISDLLPGATAAGLAHSFDSRRMTFLKPSDRWQNLFVGSIVVLVALAGWGLWNVTSLDHVISYDELFRIWLSRLPIVGALIWLAIHSSRESALAKRLEEDYGYKAAIAECFQGFQERLKEIDKTTEPDSALSHLYANTLAIIANPPGRIYEKHALTATPTDGALEAAKSIAGSVVKPTQ